MKCDLTELVEQTVEMLAARAATKGIELLCDSPTTPLPRVRMDAVRLRQVLVNLGGNAVKFTERGEVILRLLPLHVQDGRLDCTLSRSPIPVSESHRKTRRGYSRSSPRKMPRPRGVSAAPGLAWRFRGRSSS